MTTDPQTPSDRIAKLEECIAIAERCGNKYLKLNLLKALKEEYRRNNG